ncbi:hypothetical protein FGRMN_2809 [Fusarium graminum]|nr:hypothetical protein FGRMN_2809 [Fusarium graminum]
MASSKSTMHQEATAIAPLNDNFVNAFLLTQYSMLSNYNTINPESCRAQLIHRQGISANQLHEGPSLQGLDICYASPDEDIGVKDAPALPPYDYLTSFTSFGTGLSAMDFAMLNQPYEFPQSEDLIPFFNPLGTYINPTGFLETIYPYKTKFLDFSLPLLKTGINGVDYSALYQSYEEDMFASSSDISSLVALTCPAIKADTTDISSPLPTLRSSIIASQYPATNSTSPVPSEGESTTTADHPDDITLSRQEEYTQTRLSISSDFSPIFTHQKPVRIAEYIDLTEEDESDAGILRLGLPELRPGRISKSIVTEVSKAWVPLSADGQHSSGTKRKRARENKKTPPQTHQTKPKKTKRARLQAPSLSNRETSSRLGDGQLRLEVKEILFQNHEGVELTSYWTSGKWSLPLDRNEITSITFTVNSGNFSQLCFYKVKRNDIQDELWECKDIKGIYEISLSEDEIVELMNKPKGGLLKTYILSKP